MATKRNGVFLTWTAEPGATRAERRLRDSRALSTVVRKDSTLVEVYKYDSNKKLLTAINKKEVDIRDVIRYAVRNGHLTEKEGRDMSTDQFRSWLSKAPILNYETT